MVGDYVPVALAFCVVVGLALVIVRQIRKGTGTRSRISEGCHRIGIVIGGLFAALFVFGSPFWALQDGDPLTFVYGELLGILLFLIPYCLLRLVGWIFDRFVTGAKSRA
jgi:hypothetical protein